MLRILGDINFADWYFDQGFGVGTSIKNGENPFKHFKRNSEDFWIGNFECVCADGCSSHFPFVIKPSELKNFSHMNLYGVANNHSMQAGDEGYASTLEFLDSEGIKHVGSNVQPVIRFEHQGKTIGIYAFSMRPDNFTEHPDYVHLPELSEIDLAIKSLSDCDFRIVFVHWGYEFINYPNIEQKALAHFMIDNGADLIIGMHPHVAQGYEVYKDKYIFYSLGNSVFNMAWEPTKYGLMVSVDLPKSGISVDYTLIGHDGFPTVVKEVPYKYSIEYLNSLILINEENEKYFAKGRVLSQQYRKANQKRIIKDLMMLRNKGALSMITDFIKRRLVKQ